MNVHVMLPAELAPPRWPIETQLLGAVAAALGVAGTAELGRTERTTLRGGLAPWQEKRVLRFIADNAGDTIPVGSLAALARLSPSHFSRAFRVSFGVSPHVMVCRHRLGKAMRLMLSTDWPLAEIANASGFTDQSHFSRLFRRHVAISPGRWRRDNRFSIHKESANA